MKYPKSIYVKFEKVSNEEEFLIADADINGFVGVGEKMTVGIYKLIATQEIEGTILKKKERPA